MMLREPVRTVRVAEFTADTPPRNYRGVVYTPGRAHAYSTWRSGHIEGYCETESEAWTRLAKPAAQRDGSGRFAA